ncbi:MAG TPA: DHA2 family efflux MFS transporter permease subunit [Chloroflexota bacterium]|nr:DHA2 family efflux MFS transporter permease subunit [Chloroflexota bacterium]
MAQTRAAPAEAPVSGTRNPWLVLLVLCLGFFMILLDTTIVNIAIPSMIDALHASLDQILWVLNAYILVYAVLLISAGRLGDLYGQRNLFALGLFIFTVASAICGLAQTTDQLIAARVVQGVGGALLTPQTLAIITTIFPPQRRGAAFGIWGAVAGVAAVLGPTLGGFIVTYWSWRGIFYVNLPVGILALVGAFVIVPDLRPGRRHGLDLVGVLLASGGLFGIVFGLIEGQRYSWGAIAGWLTIPEIIAAGVVVLFIFVIWERFQAEPLVPLSLFSDRNYSLMNWISAVMSFGMLGLFLPLTIYFQSVLGMTALRAGLTLAPMSLVSMVVAPNAGRLVDRIGGKYILMVGLGLFALGMGLIVLVAAPDATWQTFFFPAIVAGLGMGCIFAPLSAVAMRNIKPQMAGAASGVLNTTRQVGGVVGSAVVGAVLQNRLASALHDQAVAYSVQLPEQFRAAFVSGFSNAAQGGLDVGRGQTGAQIQLPPGVPAAVGQQLAQIGKNVFVHGFINAMRPTLSVSIIVIVVGSVSCLLVQRQKAADSAATSREQARERQEDVALTAG